MFHAIQRGSGMNIDLADNWDFWPYVSMPVEEVQEKIRTDFIIIFQYFIPVRATKLL
ncbi:MAG: hypothetical protein H7A23_18700 [Leptospiraceae bacterium]|nr:hypothetical protein [Leptospiraceae bacterium]